jgi:hypothetical protein
MRRFVSYLSAQQLLLGKGRMPIPKWLCILISSSRGWNSLPGPKREFIFSSTASKGVFFELINPSFCGGGFSLIVVGEFRASEYSLGGLE